MGFMGELFGGKKKISTPTPPPAPSVPDEKALEAQERQKMLEKRRRAVGTMLTSPTGLEQNSQSTGKSLLGG